MDEGERRETRGQKNVTREERWSPGDEPDDGGKVARREIAALRWAEFTSASSNILNPPQRQDGQYSALWENPPTRGARFSFHTKQPNRSAAETPPPQQGALPCC